MISIQEDMESQLRVKCISRLENRFMYTLERPAQAFAQVPEPDTMAEATLESQELLEAEAAQQTSA